MITLSYNFYLPCGQEGDSTHQIPSISPKAEQAFSKFEQSEADLVKDTTNILEHGGCYI